MSTNTAWIVLVGSGLFETVWAVGLKYTDGFTRLGPTIGVLAAMAISVYGLGLVVKVLPVGTAYAVWAGIGAVGTAVLGMAMFGEPRTVARLACIALIVSGIVGLKLFADA